MRRVFRYDGPLNWYPGHMVKGTRQLVEAMPRTHLLLELRDARVRCLVLTLLTLSSISLGISHLSHPALSSPPLRGARARVCVCVCVCVCVTLRPSSSLTAVPIYLSCAFAMRSCNMRVRLA